MADKVTVAAAEMESAEVVTVLKSDLVALKADRAKLRELEAQLETIKNSAAPLKDVTVEDVDDIDDTDAVDGIEVDDIDAEKEVGDHA